MTMGEIYTPPKKETKPSPPKKPPVTRLPDEGVDPAIYGRFVTWLKSQPGLGGFAAKFDVPSNDENLETDKRFKAFVEYNPHLFRPPTTQYPQAYEPETGGFIPTVYPSGEPRPPRTPQTAEEYLTAVYDYVQDKLARGMWIQEQADLTLDQAGNQIKTYGIQENSQLYKEIIVEPIEKYNKDVVQWYKEQDVKQKQAAELEKQQAAIRQYEYEQQAAEKTHEFLVGQQEQRSPVWQEFNQRYQQTLDIAKREGVNYDRTAGVLLNLVNELGGKVSVDPTAFKNLLRKATNDAFSVATPEEQARLREVPELARAYQRGKIDVFGKPIQPSQPTQYPNYETAFQGISGGLGGTQYWKNWYESTYASQLSKFKAGQPKEATAAESEAGWAEFLKKRQPVLKEEYAKQYPFGAQGRPWAYQPAIKTVGF